MTSKDFCYWLQGYFEMTREGDEPGVPRDLTLAQVECIERHLALVFHHEIDPSYPGDQAQMQQIHDGKPPAHICHSPHFNHLTQLCPGCEAQGVRPRC